MRCGRCQWSIWSLLSQSCMHASFLLAFILFLIVGVALTCLGYLDYGNIHAHGISFRTYRVLGIIALLLCIGFLIAACVVISDCITSALDSPPDYSYQALFPSTHSSLLNVDDVTMSISNADSLADLYPQENFMSKSNTISFHGNIQGHCSSCTCSMHGIQVPVAMSQSLHAFGEDHNPPVHNITNPSIPKSSSFNAHNELQSWPATNNPGFIHCKNDEDQFFTENGKVVGTNWV